MSRPAAWPVPSETTPFAHASEAELARILDFYDVRWAYEPDTFPIGWSLDGDVVESFSPDFYLPDLELYVELTTLKQSLVRKKNRKLRRLRELYPAVRIKLFYARDFRMLLLKFGRLALVDELSGTTGQATPPRRPTTVLEASAGQNDAGTQADEDDEAVDGTRSTPAAAEALITTDAAGSPTNLAVAEPRSARTRRSRRRGRRRGSHSQAAGIQGGAHTA